MRLGLRDAQQPDFFGGNHDCVKALEAQSDPTNVFDRGRVPWGGGVEVQRRDCLT